MTLTKDTFSGKVALVTGAGSGIGESIARTLAAAGATVIVADINDVAAKEAAESIGAAAHPAVADVSDAKSMADLVERVVREHGRLDIAVNNAGIGGASALWASTPSRAGAR